LAGRRLRGVRQLDDLLDRAIAHLAEREGRLLAHKVTFVTQKLNQRLRRPRVADHAERVRRDGTHLRLQAAVLDESDQRLNRWLADAPEDARRALAVLVAWGAQDFDQWRHRPRADARQRLGGVI